MSERKTTKEIITDFYSVRHNVEITDFLDKVWLSEESVKKKRQQAYDDALAEALRITRLPGRTGLTWSDVERVLAIASQKTLCLGEKE